MKIVSLITTFTSGGAEVLVSNLSGAFSAAGHDSLVVALCPASIVGNDTRTETEQRARIEAAGGRTGILSTGDRRNLIGGAIAMRRLLRREKPDVIHAHTIRAILLLALAGVSVPVVATHHNSRLSFPPMLFRLLGKTVSAYVGISDECCDLLASKTGTEIVKIVNATGPGFLADGPRKTMGSPAELLAVGALTDQKNYPMMIEAAAMARAKCPDRPFRLRVAGNGAIRAALQEKIDSLGAGQVVTLLGDCNNVAELMREADIFVNASHYEGMPIAMLEALQSALPVVATNVAGTRELVRDGENGILAKPGDAAIFADAICRMLSSPQDYAKMSAAALEEGRKYRLDYCAGAHLQLYERLAKA
ncbi:glycosyltransferase involved in cell wall biosynthesis [Altererythrobacter atlanticus]|uniref:Glycosyltransferase EpsD n=1 Tax=Croceibacterium atlanticum TaxID=1267766 RepID=A0A0F7KQN0_9SPHN|nr:glycosyltransferase [Croceibacterium atlanticum]AKH42843.1 Putative glycosyltransferase EpsD [Croceibacterium atlanticum]MBB5731623.1 glycosyltransferase involved in cell wall biosynthesis [Croceibacterium atlanticum]